MITIYDLLEVNENASKEEIEKAYFKLIEEYKIDPSLSVEENNDNEIILRKLKLAYEILTNDEKRKRYDADLAQKRAEELIKNVTINSVSDENEESFNSDDAEEKVSNSNSQNNVKDSNTQGNNVQTNNVQSNNINSNNTQNNKTKYKEKKVSEERASSDVELTASEKKKIKYAAKKEFKQDLKKAQKAEEEYNKAYNEIYNDYLRKMGYSVKEPMTFTRIKNLIIGLLIITCICVLIWKLPPTRALLIQIYEENFIVKALVDIAVKLFNAIIGAFK